MLASWLAPSESEFIFGTRKHISAIFVADLFVNMREDLYCGQRSADCLS